VKSACCPGNEGIGKVESELGGGGDNDKGCPAPMGEEDAREAITGWDGSRGW